MLIQVEIAIKHSQKSEWFAVMIEQSLTLMVLKKEMRMTFSEQRPNLGIGNIQIDACAQIATRTTYIYQQYMSNFNRSQMSNHNGKRIFTSIELFDNYFGAERTGTQCGSPPAKRKGHVPREVDYPQHPAPIHRQQTQSQTLHAELYVRSIHSLTPINILNIVKLSRGNGN
jgi:hypothetical protein